MRSFRTFDVQGREHDEKGFERFSAQGLRRSARDRTLIAESPAILDSLIASLKEEEADIVLVAGDLTKDGERQSHLLMARKLAELERCGKKAYAVPVNHDVNNPESFGYSEEGSYPVDSVSPREFARIYKDFGVGEALSRDPDPLSYAAMPVYGLLVLALDSCRYEENAGRSRNGRSAQGRDHGLDQERRGESEQIQLHYR